MKITASFLKSNLSKKDTINKLTLTDVDYIHVDIMDGLFVEPSFGSSEAIDLLSDVNKPLDIHLMCQYPMEYINLLSELKPKYLTIHIEVNDDIHELIKLIHEYGIKAGLAINPETDADTLKEYLGEIEYIIIMGVHPGYGGQQLIPDVINKARYYQYLKQMNNYNYEICLDGGVNKDNRNILNDFDTLVGGSFVCMSDDYQARINELR